MADDTMPRAERIDSRLSDLWPKLEQVAVNWPNLTATQKDRAMRAAVYVVALAIRERQGAFHDDEPAVDTL